MQLAFESITEDPVHVFEKKSIHLSVLRLDKIHPVIAGNKWFKLQYYLKEAKEQQKKKIITFGGAWSNHIVATAAACQSSGLSSMGIIRGEEPTILSPTLVQAKEYGMQLYFVSREDYSDKKIPADIDRDDSYVINEGGYGRKGADGAGDILKYSKGDFNYCCCAVGTGTMMAGLINAASASQNILGISVLKNNHELDKDVACLLNGTRHNWQLVHEYHFGGYAKYTSDLILFMNEFYEQTNIPSDIVYTAKLFFAISDLVKRDFFPRGSKILLVHSGGLQGNRSLGKGTLIY